MTSISSPTSLATFSQPHASSSKLPHVTLSPVRGRETHLAVAAVQGDGIWTYDLSTLRPSTSFTVAPLTQFNTGPVSFYPPSRLPSKSSGKQRAEEVEEGDVSEDSRAERVTLVGVLQGDKVKAEEQGRVVWVWKGEEGVKSTITLDHPIQSLHHVPHHRAVVFCVHANGHLTALDGALQTRSIHIPSTLPHVIAAQVLGEVVGSTVRIALLDKQGEFSVVEVDVSGPREMNGQIVKRGNLLEDLKNAQIDRAEISTDGTINATVSGRKEVFISRSIKSFGVGEKPPLGPTLLQSLSAWPLPLPTAGRPVSLLAVAHPEPTLLLASSSGYLTAVMTASSLSSIAPVPESAVTHLAIVATPAPGSFVVALTLNYNSEGGSRSAVHTVEITLPAGGIGMNLLIGTLAETVKYFAPASSQSAKPTPFDTFLAAFTKDLEGGKAWDAFDKYLQKEEAAFKPAGKAHSGYAMPENQVKSVLTAVLDSALGSAQEGAVGAAGDKYEKKIIAELLKRKWVSDGMYPSGVLSALVKLRDWENASRAVRTIPTIASDATVSLVKAAIHAEPPVNIETILRDVLASPTPPPDYRHALRAALPVEDATRILEVYAKWLAVHVEKRGEALTGWTESTNTKRGKVPKPKEPGNVPALESLVAHASSLLDSHLPLFLSHPPAYEPLQSLQDALGPLVALQESYRKLRAPVEAVLTLSRREARKQEEAESRRETVRANTNVNGAKAKTANKANKADPAGMPDQAVGKWRVEQFVF